MSGIEPATVDFVALEEDKVRERLLPPVKSSVTLVGPGAPSRQRHK